MSGPIAGSRVNASKLTGVQKLFIYIAVVLFLSGSLSGGLYLLLLHYGFSALDFGAFSFRAMEVLAILGSIPLLVSVGLPGRAAWGLGHNPRYLNDLGRGLLLGIASLSLISAVLLIFDLRVIRPDLITDPWHWVDVVVRSMLSAILIAVIEEAWFRGALQSLFTHLWRPIGGITVTAAFYAIAHFLRPEDVLNAQPVQIWSGFDVLVSRISSIDFVRIQDSLAALFVVGVLLGILRAREGGIAMCIGAHVGWVFVIKVYKKFTYLNPQADLSMLVGQYDGVMGWLTAGLLVLLTLTIWYGAKPPRSLDK